MYLSANLKLAISFPPDSSRISLYTADMLTLVMASMLPGNEETEPKAYRIIRKKKSQGTTKKERIKSLY